MEISDLNNIKDIDIPFQIDFYFYEPIPNILELEENMEENEVRVYFDKFSNRIYSFYMLGELGDYEIEMNNYDMNIGLNEFLIELVNQIKETNDELSKGIDAFHINPDDPN